MLRDLPHPRHEILPQAPVELVVWQLQFSEPADVVAPSVGTTLVERLSQDNAGSFQLQRLNAQTFSIALPMQAGQGLPQTEQAQIEGWVLRRGAAALTINRQALSIETNIYEGWASFRALIGLALTALADTVVLPGERRLGLRYVDRVVRPGVRKLEDWSQLLAPWLIGPLAHAQLRDSVAAYAQQVDFDPDTDGIRATLRQRAFADAEHRGQQTIILDFDVFREGYRLVEPEETLGATDQMSDTAHRLFEASITEPLYAAFAAESEEA